MKKIILPFIAVMLVACSDDETLGEKGLEKGLLAPSSVSIERGDPGAIVRWKDNSNGEEKFVIERKQTDELEYTVIGSASANSTEFEDVELSSDPESYYYRVKAVNKNGESRYGNELYNHVAANGVPKINTPTFNSTYSRVAVKYSLAKDGGEKCTTGICWSENTIPTIHDNTAAYSGNVVVGNKMLQVISNLSLEYGKEYNVRAYVTSRMGTFYSAALSVSLADELEPITFKWSKIPALSQGLPSEVEVYETVSTLNGKPIKAWYAIADLSTGKIGMKVNLPTLPTVTTEQAKGLGDNCLVLINGGYFDTKVSNESKVYGLLFVDGVKKKDPTALMSGSATAGDPENLIKYPVAQPSMLINESGKLSFSWMCLVGSNVYAHNRPLMSIKGEPLLATPSATNPTQGTVVTPTYAVEAGPMLLKDGKIPFDYSKTDKGNYMTNYDMRFDDIFTDVEPSALAHRTAVGYRADGKVVFFVCDGRQEGVSMGARLDDVARIMAGLGCTDAINMDGGGSTTMVVKGKKVNWPFGKDDIDGERKVATTIGFFSK